MKNCKKISMQVVTCEWCKKKFFKYPSEIRKHNFCCNDCRLQSWRKYVVEVINVPGHTKGTKRPHLSALNKRKIGSKNPMNRPEVRKKVGDALRDRGECKTYRKLNSRHEHRVVAEQALGRLLMEGEIVHHIDGNKRNNAPENLMICTKAEHAKIHFSKKQGGGANEHF